MTLPTRNAADISFTTGMVKDVRLEDCDGGCVVAEQTAQPSRGSSALSAEPIAPETNPAGMPLGEKRTRPSIESVISAICVEARKDSLRYVLRNDVGHDGE